MSAISNLENESVGIGKSQTLRIEGNARINKVLAMRPGLAKIIEKVHISRSFEHAENMLVLEQITCSIVYTDTGLSKRAY